MTERSQVAVGANWSGERVASEIDLFRFSAVTWNAHRIHLDAEWARAEGLAGPIVQAHLHGAWLGQIAREVGGSAARLRQLSWANRRGVVAGEPVTIDATVVAIDALDSGLSVSMELAERDHQGQVCVTGAAVVTVPAVER